MKRGKLNDAYVMFFSTNNTAYNTSLRLESNTLIVYLGSASNAWALSSGVLLRDPASHYHIQVSVDTTRASASERCRIYLNGATLILTGPQPPQNQALTVNSVMQHNLGINSTHVLHSPFDGYLSDVCFVDGLALGPEYFGRKCPISGEWEPIKPRVSNYGTNGFFLEFKNAAALGTDTSGNGNNWTTNGGIVAANQYIDTPTNNFAVLNPLGINRGTPVLSAGNLTNGDTASLAVWGSSESTFRMTTGRWYFESTGSGAITTDPIGNSGIAIGVVGSATPGSTPGTMASSVGYTTSGQKIVNGVFSAYGAAYTTSVIGCAFDADARTVEFYRDGILQGTISIDASPIGYTFAVGAGWAYAGAVFNNANFGQRPFAYTPPAGFKSLCTRNISSIGTVTVSGTFTGNANADGPFVWMNGTPETLTINGNAVTFGTHADKLANGFKVRTSSASYNASGSNTWTATVKNPQRKSLFKFQTAKGNP